MHTIIRMYESIEPENSKKDASGGHRELLDVAVTEISVACEDAINVSKEVDFMELVNEHKAEIFNESSYQYEKNIGRTHATEKSKNSKHFCSDKSQKRKPKQKGIRHRKAILKSSSQAQNLKRHESKRKFTSGTSSLPGTTRPHKAKVFVKCDSTNKESVPSDNLTCGIKPHSEEQRLLESFKEFEEAIFRKANKQKYLADTIMPSNRFKKNKYKHTQKSPIKCGKPSKSFKVKNVSKAKQCAETDGKPFKCELCGKRFALARILQIHKRTHAVQKIYKCNFCHAQFAYLCNLKSHERVHKKEPLTCKYCEKGFGEASALMEHESMHTEEKPYTRTLSKNVVAPNILKKLYNLEHTEENRFKYEKTSEMSMADQFDDDKKRYTCDLCGRVFLWATTFKIHNLTQHAREKPFQCNCCSKHFVSLRNLKRHERLHKGKSPFVCKHCGKQFNTSGIFIKHERTRHSPKKLQSDSESEEFILPDSPDLKQVKNSRSKHQTSKKEITKLLNQYTEADGKPFHCEFCGKGFFWARTLIVHKRIHTGEKPFKCKCCGKKFADFSNLKTHERVHTGEKPFVCVHCNKGFAQSGVLTRHERIHTGEKPFACEKCKKAFSRKSQLNDHECAQSS